MGGFDYSGVAATLDRLVAKFGRPVELILPREATEDPDAPWETATLAGDRVTGVPAIFPSISITRFLETAAQVQIPSGSRGLVVSAASLDGRVIDDRWKVLDGTTLFTILGAVPIQPGPVVLGYFLRVNA